MDDRYVGTGFDLFDQSCFWVLYTCVVKRNNLMEKDAHWPIKNPQLVTICLYVCTVQLRKSVRNLRRTTFNSPMIYYVMILREMFICVLLHCNIRMS